jgi:diguanylate cyclase (GGDEF)-like protein
MSTVNELIETARANEQIARNLFEIEVEIMNITRCADFFEQLLRMVREKFAIEYAWIAMANIPANEYLLESLKSVEFELPSYVSVPMIDFLQATKSSRTPLLQNEQVSRLRNMLPKEYKSALASVATLPLTIDRKVVGSLMLGSSDKQRYSPRKDHFFLQQLSVKVSLSLVGVWARERVGFLATRDPLTSLRNRRELEETLDQELSRHMRQREHIALMFIDCDDFKLVNDTHGHDVGDLYLKHVASQLVELTRKSDMVFRFAGDEFVVLLPHQGQVGADVIAKRIREHFGVTPLVFDGGEVAVAISYGVVSTESLSRVDSKILLKLADERLYEMKALKPSAQIKTIGTDHSATVTASA